MMGQKASFPMDYNMLSVSFYIQLLIRSAATISISLLALLSGMIAKSSKVTVISSFLLIILMQGNVGGATSVSYTHLIWLPGRWCRLSILRSRQHASYWVAAYIKTTR